MRRRTLLPLRGLLALAGACLAVGGLAGAADAQPGLLVGVADDAFATQPELARAAGQGLGLDAARVILRWDGRRSALGPDDREFLRSALEGAGGARLVVAITGAKATDAPQDDAARAAYCDFAADVLRGYPAIRDVVVWNEPNTSRFWRPQYDAGGRSVAPAAYEALLATCWDALHAVRPSANVISSSSTRGNDQASAPSNVSHSPSAFLLGMGAAYRASGRTLPIMDTIGHHAYASTGSESPTAQHAGTAIGQGDVAKLLAALDAAFGGTAQQVPTRCAARGCPTIWYLETGFQTAVPPERAQLYSGTETDGAPLPDVGGGRTLSDQVRDGVVLAYCQPGVGAYFNFMLADEARLAGWQSGLLWADGSPKRAYEAFGQAIAAVHAGTIACGGEAPAPPQPAAAPPVPTAPAPPAPQPQPQPQPVEGGGPVIVRRQPGR